MPARPEDDMPRHGAYVLRLWETRSTPPDATRWRLSLEDIHTGEKHRFRDLEELRAFLEEWMGADAYIPTWRLREELTLALQDPSLARPEQGKDERVEDEPITERTVVCIEDEPDMIALIKLALERHGIRLIGALGGLEGLELVRRMKPDLVLLDLMMPDVNGAEVLKRMKADDSLTAIPIIVITVLDPYYSAKQGVDLERIDAFIRKPFAPQELVETVNATLKPVP